MLIRFLRDFRSALTNEVFYRAGDEADMAHGAALIAEGVAVAVVEPEPEPEPEPTKPPPPAKPKGRAA